MKKVFALCALILLVSGALFAQIKSNSQAWVSSKTADVKSGTGFFSSKRATLQMSNEVTVLQLNGNWAEIRSGSLVGWVAVSNLSARRIVASGSSATASEIALAGKGFSQEVEDSYKTSGTLNYDDVDRTEAITVSIDDLYAFVTEGRLKAGE